MKQVVLLLLLGLICPSFHQSTSKVNSLCSNDKECGPNEECVIPRANPPCKKGTCQCKACFGLNDTESGTCAPVYLVRTACGPENLGVCDSDLTAEVYPPNALCNGAYVQCDDCYERAKGICVPEYPMKAPEGAKCESSCECQSGLSCLGKCGCPVATRMRNSTSCVPIEYGDSCRADEECQNGDSYMWFGQCKSGTCGCDDEHVPLRVGFESGLEEKTVTKTICGTKTSRIAELGGSCSASPFNEDSDTDDTGDGPTSTTTPRPGSGPAFCAAGTACIGCSVPTSAMDYKCRKYTKREEPDWSTCGSVVEVVSNRPGRGGEYCQNDTECGANERCEFTDVTPRCRYGICACKPCFDQDFGTEKCVLVKRLNIGDRCSLAAVERYPDHAECLSTGSVVCSEGFMADPSNKNCIEVETVKKQLVFGDKCAISGEDTCSGDLTCLDEESVCARTPSVTPSTTSNECFQCPENVGESSACAVRLDKPRVNTAEACLGASAVTPLTCPVESDEGDDE